MNSKRALTEKPAPGQLPSLQLGGEAAATQSNAIEITLPTGVIILCNF